MKIASNHLKIKNKVKCILLVLLLRNNNNKKLKTKSNGKLF